MNIRNWICKTFCSHLVEEIDALQFALAKKIARNVVKPPEKWGRLLRDDCYLIFRKQLDVSGARLILGGKYYFPIDNEDMNRFLKANPTDLIPYTKTYICRNFSLKLLGDLQIPGWDEFAVFVVWADGHAFNCFIDHNNTVWYIEPQTDEIFLPSSIREKKYQHIGLIFN